MPEIRMDQKGAAAVKISPEIMEGILDAYPYEIVFADRTHTVRYMNRTAQIRYGDRVKIGESLFRCHNENSRKKIEEFLAAADQGAQGEMFETYNRKTGEREFFVPVRDTDGSVIGYFERHEMPWDASDPARSTAEYWKNRI